MPFSYRFLCLLSQSPSTLTVRTVEFGPELYFIVNQTKTFTEPNSVNASHSELRYQCAVRDFRGRVFHKLLVSSRINYQWLCQPERGPSAFLFVFSSLVLHRSHFRGLHSPPFLAQFVEIFSCIPCFLIISTFIKQLVLSTTALYLFCNVHLYLFYYFIRIAPLPCPTTTLYPWFKQLRAFTVFSECLQIGT